MGHYIITVSYFILFTYMPNRPTVMRLRPRNRMTCNILSTMSHPQLSDISRCDSTCTSRSVLRLMLPMQFLEINV
jgi:hypothetical protein